MAAADNNEKHLSGLVKEALHEEFEKVRNNEDLVITKKGKRGKNETFMNIDLMENIMLKGYYTLIRGMLDFIYTRDDDSKDRNKITETKIEEVRKAHLDTHVKLEVLQQYGRSDTIRIMNIPEPELNESENEKEDTNSTVTKFLKDAGIAELEPKDISTSHRLPVRSPDGIKIKAIICKLSSRQIRDKIIKSKKMIKKKQNDNAEFRKNYPKAFIVEDVSKTRQNIMFKLRKDDSYAHVWLI